MVVQGEDNSWAFLQQVCERLFSSSVSRQQRESLIDQHELMSQLELGCLLLKRDRFFDQCRRADLCNKFGRFWLRLAFLCLKCLDSWGIFNLVGMRGSSRGLLYHKTQWNHNNYCISTSEGDPIDWTWFLQIVTWYATFRPSTWYWLACTGLSRMCSGRMHWNHRILEL